MSGIKPAPGAGFEKAADDREWMTFTFWHEDTILIPIAVNGVRTTAMMDSAAVASVIDLAFAATAKVPLSSVSQAFAGPGGKFAASRSGELLVSIGASPMPLPWAAVVDLSQLSSALGGSIGFILGQDILRNRVFDFRFDTNKFSVRSNALGLDTAGLTELSLARGVRREPTIEIEIEGREPVAAAVDTGNSSPLLLSAAYAKKAGLSPKRSSTGLSVTANGLSTNRLVTLDRIRLGHLDMADVPAEIFENWTADGSPANIGMPLLAGRRLVFDFGHDRIWRSPFTAASLRRDRSGLGIAAEVDRLVVVHVASGSPAMAGGWKRDEQIFEVDGQRIGPSYNSGDLWRWRFRPAGTLVSLKMKDGSVRHLRLGDYY